MSGFDAAIRGTTRKTADGARGGMSRSADLAQRLLKGLASGMTGTRRTGASGFTIVELMFVVVILGILSTVAVVSFRKYSLRVKTNEAYSMLGMIRAHQETYKQEFSVYCDVSSSSHDGTSGSSAGTFPTSAPGQLPVAWGTSPAEWVQLGVRPAGPVYFRYQTVAGVSPTVPSFFWSDLGYGASGSNDPWWAAHAFGPRRRRRPLDLRGVLDDVGVLGQGRVRVTDWF